MNALPLDQVPAAARHPASDRARTTLGISAVLPAYNEEALIERTVRRLAAVLRGLTDDYEVVVTNDGSRDRPGEVHAALGTSEPELHLRVVTHAVNQGYGPALASVFDAATRDLIFFTDG